MTRDVRPETKWLHADDPSVRLQVLERLVSRLGGGEHDTEFWRCEILSGPLKGERHNVHQAQFGTLWLPEEMG